MSRLKKTILIFLGIMGLTAFHTVAFAEYFSTPVPTSAPRTQPKIKLASPTFVDLVSGQTKTFTITVKNVGNTWANNIFTAAKIDSENAPFTLEFVNKTNYIATMSMGNSKDMTMKVIVDNDAPSGSYAVTLTHSFINEENEVKTETDTLYIKVDNIADSFKPNIVMNSFKSSSDSIVAGDNFSITAWVENAGAQKASDVQILLEGLKTDEIYMANSTNSAIFKALEGGQGDNITYNLAASNKVKRGSYPLVFKVKFKDKDNKDYEKEYYYYVNIGGGAAVENKASVQVTKLTNPSGTYDVGSTFQVEMELTNHGMEEARNMKISVIPDGDGAIVPRSSSIQTIASLVPEGKKELTFSFSPTAKSKTQNYAVGFTIEYETGETGDDNKPVIISYGQYIGVNVSNPEAEKEDEKDKDKDEKTSIPKIIVSQYASDPIMVKAGQEFDLSMSFQNTHSTKSIENIRAYLTVVQSTDEKGSVFTPVNCSNTFYIDKIPPKGVSHQKLRMYTVPDAKPRTYTIEVNFEYQDQAYNEYQAKELIGINVKQYTKLDTSEINFPQNGFVGQPVNIGFDFYNTGKADLYNLIIKVEGNFDTTASTVYYGKFTMYNSNYYDGTFVPTEPGLQEGKLIMTYEDDAGEQMETVREFTMDVMEMGMPDEFQGGDMMGRPGDNMSDSTGIGNTAMNLVKNPYVWGGAAATVGVIVFGAKKLKKRRKGIDLDE